MIHYFLIIFIQARKTVLIVSDVLRNCRENSVELIVSIQSNRKSNVFSFLLRLKFHKLFRLASSVLEAIDWRSNVQLYCMRFVYNWQADSNIGEFDNHYWITIHYHRHFTGGVCIPNVLLWFHRLVAQSLRTWLFLCNSKIQWVNNKHKTSLQWKPTTEIMNWRRQSWFRYCVVFLDHYSKYFLFFQQYIIIQYSNLYYTYYTYVFFKRTGFPGKFHLWSI